MAVMSMVMPAHLDGLLRTILNRRGGAGTGQRHGLRSFSWSSQHEQSADGG
jgi:hypothetical protein